MSKEETFFDVIKSICNHSRREWQDIEHLYLPFMINKAMSFEVASILFANELNKFHSVLSNHQQYDFLFNSYEGKKFIKWVKKDEEDDSNKIEFLMEHFELSEAKAKELSPLYDDIKIEALKEKYYYNKKEFYKNE